MRGKLSLKLEDLAVDSFDTAPVHPSKGTVFGEQCSCQTVCSCPGCPTCEASCNGSCYEPTCHWTCEGDTCGSTCDDPCVLSRKYTNCDGICY
jgi:hypothetical protein